MRLLNKSGPVQVGQAVVFCFLYLKTTLDRNWYHILLHFLCRILLKFESDFDRKLEISLYFPQDCYICDEFLASTFENIHHGIIFSFMLSSSIMEELLKSVSIKSSVILGELWIFCFFVQNPWSMAIFPQLFTDKQSCHNYRWKGRRYAIILCSLYFFYGNDQI